MANVLLEKLKERPFLHGSINFSGSHITTEIMGEAGFDWVTLDMEHAPSWFDTIQILVLAAKASGTVPIVRVPENDPIYIMKALDTGAAGVIIPHVCTPEELTKALQYARYEPDGVRGACSSCPCSRYNLESWTSYYKKANENVMVIPLIEDKEAIDNFDEMLAIEGVDIYYVGTRDLAQSLGIPGADFERNEILNELGRNLCAKARKAGKALMVVVQPRLCYEYAEALVKIGFQLLSYGTDETVFAKTCFELTSHFKNFSGRI